MVEDEKEDENRNEVVSPSIHNRQCYMIDGAEVLTPFNLLSPSEIVRRAHPNEIRISNPWEIVHLPQLDYLQSINEILKAEHSIIMVAGKSNVGKSTYCRYLLNRLLTQFPRVAFLDVDVGQGEFTLEGTLALSLVSEPQLRTSSATTTKTVETYR